MRDSGQGMRVDLKFLQAGLIKRIYLVRTLEQSQEQPPGKKNVTPLMNWPILPD